MGEKHSKHIWANNYIKIEDEFRKRLKTYAYLAVPIALLIFFLTPEPYKFISTLSVFALIISLIVGDTNRHYQYKKQQFDSLFKIFELISSHEIRKSREIIHKEYCRLKKANAIISFKNSNETPDLESHVDQVLSAFDQVSATVLNGFINEELFFDTYGEMIVRDWNTLKPEIDVRQNDNKKVLRHFTFLKNRFEPRIEEKARTPYCHDDSPSPKSNTE